MVRQRRAPLRSGVCEYAGDEKSAARLSATRTCRLTAPSARLFAESLRSAARRRRRGGQLLRRRRVRNLVGVRDLAQAALEFLNTLADGRADLRDALRPEHQRNDRHENENVPDTEISQHCDSWKQV